VNSGQRDFRDTRGRRHTVSGARETKLIVAVIMRAFGQRRPLAMRTRSDDFQTLTRISLSIYTSMIIISFTKIRSVCQRNEPSYLSASKNHSRNSSIQIQTQTTCKIYFYPCPWIMSLIKCSSRSVVLREVANRATGRQADRQTNAGKTSPLWRR